MREKFLGCLAAVLFSAAPSWAAVIVHSPVLSAPAGQAVDIGATLSGVKPPSAARLYYRVKGKELYQSAEMPGSAFQVSGRIPGESVGVGGVEYYLEVIDASGRVTDPSSNPQLNPHFISVAQGQKAVGLTILSPLQDDVVDTSRPVITVAFDTPADIDPKDVDLSIDGAAIPDRRNLQVFSTLISYIPSAELAEGTHKIKAAVRGGAVAVVEWSFSVKNRTTAKIETARWIASGSLRAESDYAATVQQPDPAQARPSMPYNPYGTNRENVDLIARGPGQTYRLSAYVTDEERAENQPTNRYTASLATEDMIMTLGDSSPSFSELSLYNLPRLRGVNLDLRSGPLYEAHSRVEAVWGQTRRGVDTGAGTPTFSQYLYGARYEWGLMDWLQLGINGVTVSDDTNSVNTKGGINPISNTLTTSDLKLQIKPLYLTLQGEGGESLFASDPTPFGLSAGTAYLAGAHINVLPLSSKLDFEWRDLGGDFGSLLGPLNGIIPIGYNSAANPGLLPDYRGFESSFSQGLWENQAMFNLAYNNWRNNLAGIQPFATRTEYIYGSVNLVPNGLPYLNLGYGSQTQKNGANYDAGPTVTFVDTLATNLNASLGYTRPLDNGKSLNGTVSYLQNNYQDLAPAPKTSQDSVAHTYVLALMAALGATTLNGAYSLGDSLYSSLDPLPAYSSNNTTLNLRASQAWIPRIFSNYLSYDYNGTKSDDLTKTQTGRSTYTLGGQYSPAENHSFNLSFSLVQVGLNYRTVTPDPLNPGSNVVSDALSNPYSQFYTSASYQFTF